MSWFRDEARKIFGACGEAFRIAAEGAIVCKVGYTSRYGFHPRGTGATEQAALDAARASKLPDDPVPANQSWVPSSLTDPFTPYRAMEVGSV